MINLQYDADARKGYGEELTNELRVRNGVLQQKVIVSCITDKTPLTVTEEWRDVPRTDE